MNRAPPDRRDAPACESPAASRAALSHADEAPIGAQEFAAALDPLLPVPYPALAIAVSGGGDSMAALTLTHEWAKTRRVTLHAVTVDHRLRPDSAQDAAFVSEWCLTRGISHRTLLREGDTFRSAIQARARAARLSLLSRHCAQNTITHLLLAHTRDDQAETFLMRLARASDIDGLGAMHPTRRLCAMTILRPLLVFSRRRLRATLRARGIGWREDPANADPRFFRTNARRVMAALAPLGIDAPLLCKAAERMRHVSAMLAEEAGSLVRRAVRADAFGVLHLDHETLRTANDEIVLRLLRDCLMVLGGRIYPPRRRKLTGLLQWIRSDPICGGRTLSGVLFRPGRKAGRHGIFLLREPSAIEGARPLVAGQSFLWDNRFRVTTGAALCERLTLAPLGTEGARALSEITRKGEETWHPGREWRALPAAARHATPAIWRGDTLRSSPLANYRPCREIVIECALDAGFRRDGFGGDVFSDNEE